MEMKKRGNKGAMGFIKCSCNVWFAFLLFFSSEIEFNKQEGKGGGAVRSLGMFKLYRVAIPYKILKF